LPKIAKHIDINQAWLSTAKWWDMAQLRLLLIITLCWFAILFNIERISELVREPITLDATVYAVVIITSVALLTFPNLSSVNIWLSRVVMLAIYGAARLVFTPNLNSGVLFPYNLLMDVVALMVTLWIMRQVGHALLQFELTVQAFVLDVESARLLSRSDGQEQVNHELYRARRFERPVAVIYCSVSVPDSDKESKVVTDFIRWKITKTLKHRFLQVKLAQAIASLTYKSDFIVEYGDDVVACLPETSDHEAEVFARQLARFAKEFADLEPQIGIACFPKEGLVFEDLVQVAKSKISNWSDDSSDGYEERSGDVLVDLNERVKFARQAVWVNRLTYQSPSARAIYALLKRTFEITALLCTFPVLVPLMAIVALLIKLDDGGPIFYMQSRTGYRGRRFKMYKFRTMIQNAKAIPAEVVTLPNGKKQYLWPGKTTRDPRITRVGRFLRKSSLDELPQLLNILKGDMSLVGPRPTTWELDMYTLHQTERLTVRPGLTGLWQVCARETQNFDERLLWDLKYIEKMSMSLDLQIIFRTVAQVFQKKGA
jgi:lipopolysaccharide/colanic/teichoic acid biosynthesis glycosyltransferase